MKKKLETDVGDLGMALDHANANNVETQKTIQKYQLQVRDVQAKFEEESHAKIIAQDNLVTAERKANANKNALEEARTLLEQTDRNRRMLEQDTREGEEVGGRCTVYRTMEEEGVLYTGLRRRKAETDKSASQWLRDQLTSCIDFKQKYRAFK
ncbi:myosin heavy chain, muscle [Eurytemora carolleeae]|uniref:myosin heavy chain, muscle n=1 Tax=Eurytemora carolleeae TaxID=1294199 RepID=UPI000C77FD10|nr:myosin heavy chain, muscle [Eurytemora carolleeae]|eukprot:XP_023329504.1 myosin heavy chain, muscle-like [Eurytemora affinis]